MPGHVDRDHCEVALAHEAAGPLHDVGSLLVLTTAVSHEDQGAGADSTLACPQHTGKVTEEEELLGNTVGQGMREEAHAFRAFRSALCGHSLSLCA